MSPPRLDAVRDERGGQEDGDGDEKGGASGLALTLPRWALCQPGAWRCARCPVHIVESNSGDDIIHEFGGEFGL